MYINVISHRCAIDVSLVLDNWFVSHDITCKKCYKCKNAEIILTDLNPLSAEFSLIAPNIDELYKGLIKCKPSDEIIREFTNITSIDEFAYKLADLVKNIQKQK